MVPTTLYSDRQVALIRESGKVLSDVMAAIRGAVAPGVTTRQLEKVAADVIAASGATPAFLGYVQGTLPPFPSPICTSVNNVVVHGIPDDRPLAEGDLVSVDIGIKKNDYFADSAWTFGVGKMDDVAARLLKVGEEALAAGIAAARHKARLIEVSRTIQEVVERNGFSCVRDMVGHGVGHHLHEPPQVRNYVDEEPDGKVMLRHGMVLAIEPMINEKGFGVTHSPADWAVKTTDGGRSVHFEHTVAILTDGPQLLTK